MNKPFTIQCLQDAPHVPFDLDGKILYSQERMEILHVRFKSGDDTGPHSQPFDVFIYVLEGTGLLTVEEETMECSTGALVRVDANTSRSWKNPGEGDFSILVIKPLK